MTWLRAMLKAEENLEKDPANLDRQADLTVAQCMLRDYDRENSATYAVTPAAAL
jgi:hypothetical protein